MSRKKRKSAGGAAAFHVRKNDPVYVISGKWRGEKGKIIGVLKDTARVVLELQNLSPEKQQEIGRKTVKKTPDSPKGGLIERSISVHVSNVAKLVEKKEKKDKEIN